MSAQDVPNPASDLAAAASARLERNLRRLRDDPDLRDLRALMDEPPPDTLQQSFRAIRSATDARSIHAAQARQAAAVLGDTYAAVTAAPFTIHAAPSGTTLTLCGHAGVRPATGVELLRLPLCHRCDQLLEQLAAHQDRAG